MTENKAAAGGGGAARLQFALHVIRGRWFSLFASFLIMAAVGGIYLFGIYSREIKTSLAYDQRTLNLLGFFKDLGTNIGIVSGLMAEVTPTWFLLLTGSSMNFVGYFLIWLVVTGKLAEPKVWQMCMYTFIAANSLNFANTGLLVTCVKNFPENRGILLGVLKGFGGLSGSLTTQIYLALHGNDPKSLILLIAWLPAAISLVFVYPIRTMKVARQPSEVRVLYHFLYVSIVLALFLMVLTLTQILEPFPRAAYAASGTLVCGLLFSPIFIVFREDSLLWNQKKNPSNPTTITVEIPHSSRLISTTQTEENPKTSWLNKPPRGEDYTILQALFSMDMLMLLIATACGIGSSLTAFDNLGQIGESLGYEKKTIDSFISLVSIWNYFGRIFAGLVSEQLLAKFKFPRPLMTALVLCLSCVGHLLVAFPIQGSVYVASVIIGFSLGAQYIVLNAVISELFGLKHFATLFNIGQLACPFGSYILNVKITGGLYDHEALKELSRKKLQRSLKEELTCTGSDCYRLSFIILAAAALFGALVSLLLGARTRHFYRSDIYKKFREKAEAAENCEEKT